MRLSAICHNRNMVLVKASRIASFRVRVAVKSVISLKGTFSTRWRRKISLMTRRISPWKSSLLQEELPRLRSFLPGLGSHHKAKILPDVVARPSAACRFLRPDSGFDCSQSRPPSSSIKWRKTSLVASNTST